MTWTPPPPRIPGAIITSTIWNNELATNLAHLGAPDFINVTASSTANVTNGTWTLVAFNAEIEKSGTITHDNTTNNSRIGVTTAGLYTITATIGWPANATGMRGAMIRLNAGGSAGGGTALRQQYLSSTPSQGMQFITTYTARLAASDYIELFRFQSSGGNLAPSSIDGQPAYLTMIRHGA